MATWVPVNTVRVAEGNFLPMGEEQAVRERQKAEQAESRLEQADFLLE